MTSWLVVFALALAACHSDPPPQAPTDKAQAGASSGSPIEFLIDGAGALHLRDEQVAQLRDIDTGLSGELEAIDAKLHAANKSDDQGSNSGGRGVHMRGGGMGRNGMGGRGRGIAPQGSGNDAHRAVVANGLSDQRAADVERALHSAFAVLDADQRDGAKQLLSDHDIDYDDSGDAAPAAPAPASAPAEP